MKYHLSLISLCILSLAVATPVRRHVAKRGVEITDSEINDVNDITKEHFFVEVNPETGARHQMRAVSKDRLQILQKLYIAMQKWEKDYTAGLTPAVFTINENGNSELKYDADLIFWEKTSKEALERAVESAKTIWTGRSAQAYQNIKIELQRHFGDNSARKIRRIVFIGSGGMQAETEAPGPVNGEAADEFDDELLEAVRLKQSRRRTKGAAQTALVLDIQKELKDIQNGFTPPVVFQDSTYSDLEKELLPELSSSAGGEAKVVEAPDAADFIDQNTLLISVGGGFKSFMMIKISKLPAAMLMDSRVYEIYMNNPNFNRRFRQIFDHYQSIEVAPGMTYGLDGPTDANGAASTLFFWRIV